MNGCINKTKIMKERLLIIKQLQDKYPTSHLGGSIGLFLHGVDLQRDLSKSDIDMTVAQEIDFSQPINIENLEESSSPEDFDYQFRYYPNAGSVYVKIDINIRPEKKFVLIMHDGVEYRVSRIEDIIVWKHFYSMKGQGKHTDDLETIRTGIRPKEEKITTQRVAADIIDDLPF
jgi:hypothetical protein